MGREVGGGVVRGRVVQSRVWGEKQRGPWPRYQGQQKKLQEKATLETPDTDLCHPPGAAGAAATDRSAAPGPG